jgi:hypothetical protein
MRGLCHLDLKHPHVRALVAFTRYLPGPILCPPEAVDGPTPTCALAPQCGVFAVAIGGSSASVSERDVAMLRGTSRDAVLMSLGEPGAIDAFRFDIVLHDGGRFADYRLHVGPAGKAKFVPEAATGDMLFITAAGIERIAATFGNIFDRIEGIGRANAQMSMLTWGARCQQGGLVP